MRHRSRTRIGPWKPTCLLFVKFLSAVSVGTAQAGEVGGPGLAARQQRAVLEIVTPEQLEDFLAGTSPADILLEDGQRLAEFLEKMGTAFELSWTTLDAGGSTVASVGGDFELAGTVGQPDSGLSTEADFELFGGFWVDLPAVEASVFGDGFESGDTSAWGSTVGLQP